MKQHNLRSLSGRLIVTPLEEHFSDLIHLPENRIQHAGSLMRCRVLSSGCPDVKDGDVVHAKAELGFRVPMSSAIIYLLEDVLLVETSN